MKAVIQIYMKHAELHTSINVCSTTMSFMGFCYTMYKPKLHTNRYKTVGNQKQN